MKKHALMPVFWVMLLDMVSYTIRFPVLTLIFYDISTRLFSPGTPNETRSYWYGIVMACYWIGMMLAAPVLSSLSDHIGRKKVLIIAGFGTLLFAICTSFALIWGQLSLMIAAALIGGIFLRMDPIAQAAVGDVSSGKEKIVNMGYLQLFISIGAFIGPLIGGYFAKSYFFPQLNFALPFIIAAFVSLITIVIIWRFFQETAPRQTKTNFIYAFNFKTLFSNKKILGISIMLVLIQLSWSTYYQFIGPILKKNFYFSGTEIGLFMAFIAFWLALAAAFGMKILQRHFSAQQILYYGALAVFVGLFGHLILTLWPNAPICYWLNWLMAIPTSIGDVMTYCIITTLYSDAVDEKLQGQVMGANFAVVSLVWAITALLGGAMIARVTAEPLLFSLFGVGILIIMFSLISRWVFVEE